MNLLEITLFVSIGYYLSLSLYHFVVYLGRKHDQSNLFFSLLLISMSFLLFSKGIYPSLPNKSFNLEVAFDFIANLLSGSFLLLFTNSTLGSRKFIRPIYWFLISGTSATIVCIMWFLLSGNYLPPSILVVIVCAPFATFLAVRIIVHFFSRETKLYREKWRLIIFAGTIVYAVAFMTAVVLVAFDLPDHLQAFIVNIGALFLCTGSALSLASQFNKEHLDLKLLTDQLEEKVKARTKELEIANSQKTNAFINLAHEIKTPLTLINNTVKTLANKTGEIDEIVEIKYNVGRLLRDAVNFLDSEKLERGQIFYDNDKPLNLSDMLTRKIQSFQRLAEKKQITIHYHIDPHLFSQIDQYAFDRIVNNLLDNAIKYNRAFGSITVLLSVPNEDHKIHFVVEDTGIGISEEDQKAIFDPYYQASHAKRNVQGIGMGLYIVAQIIKSVGGSISLSSRINSWSRFDIILNQYTLKEGEKPLSAASISEPINDPPQYDCSDFFSDANTHTLLLVEDNQGLLHSLRETFIKEYDVICALNGEEALEKLKKYTDRKPDLVISDIMMDKMDGNEFYATFHQKEEFKEIPVIFLTAKSLEADNVEALTNGAIDYIYKPFSMDVLQAKVKSLIDFTNTKNMFFLKDKFHSLGILTASISHEILNPLSCITGLLGVMDQEAKSNQIRNFPRISILLEIALPELPTLS